MDKMFYTLWNILILLVACFACTCAGAAVCYRASGPEFFKKNFDRVETLCVEFLVGAGVLGTVWLIIAMIPGGLLGLTTSLLVFAACVFFGGPAAWRDISLAWTHIKIIVTHPQRETDISVKILHWLILAGLAGMLLPGFLPPDNFKSVSEFLVAKQVAHNGGLLMAPGTESFVGGGLLAEMNIAVLMLFGGAMAANLLGYVYMLAGLMLASGVGRRAGLNYQDRWLLVLMLTIWGVGGLQRYGNLDAFASCGMAIAAFIIISAAPCWSRATHVLAGLLLACAVMMQYMQAAVLLPAVLGCAMSVFSKPAENPEEFVPPMRRRMGWLLAPLGAMIVLWLLKNLVLYHALLPVQTDDQFTKATFLSVAILPAMLIAVIYLKMISGKKLVIGKFNCGRLAAFVWQAAAIVIVLSGVMELVNAAHNRMTGQHATSEEATDFINLAKTADPEKERVFTVSPYRYFMDGKFIASSSGNVLFAELCNASDVEKWRQLWAKNFRLFYLTGDNTSFSRDGKNFTFSIILDDGRTFKLDSTKLPPELGVDLLTHRSDGDKYTSCGYKFVLRENAIMTDDLAPLKN